MKVLIFGGGMWGTTLAKVIAENNHQCLIYDINKENVTRINDCHQTINNLDLPLSITATCDIDQAINYSNIVVLAIPTKAVIKSVQQFLKSCFNDFHIISAAKGLDALTGETISQIVSKTLGQKLKMFYTIQGPSFAGELQAEKLTFLMLTSSDSSLSQTISELFRRPYLITKVGQDLIGTELCGPVKNAFAVLTGFIKGIELGENALAAVIALLLEELSKLIMELGGEKDTIYSVAGVGDLVLTASSLTSRNFRAGLELAKGKRPSEIISAEKETIEGFDAINGLTKITKNSSNKYPLIKCLSEIINGNFDKQKFIKILSSI